MLLEYENLVTKIVRIPIFGHIPNFGLEIWSISKFWLESKFGLQNSVGNRNFGYNIRSETKFWLQHLSDAKFWSHMKFWWRNLVKYQTLVGNHTLATKFGRIPEFGRIPNLCPAIWSNIIFCRILNFRHTTWSNTKFWSFTKSNLVV